MIYESAKIPKEEIEELKKEIEMLDWGTYYLDYGSDGCTMTSCSCGAILIGKIGKCWKCGRKV